MAEEGVPVLSVDLVIGMRAADLGKVGGRDPSEVDSPRSDRAPLDSHWRRHRFRGGSAETVRLNGTRIVIRLVGDGGRRWSV